MTGLVAGLMAEQDPAAREVHAAWRDGMLKQGREVAQHRMTWDTLSAEDHELDAYIAQRVAVVAIAEIKRLGAVLERDRTKVADGLNALHEVLDGYSWLCEGRGPYRYNDERYQQEFGEALKAIRGALPPLAQIAADWTDCPRDPQEIKAARAGLTPRDCPEIGATS